MTESSTATALVIDVFADVVCPWCYIGERRLERALERRPAVQVTRRWRPFQLQPRMPAAGMPWAEFVRVKFGGPDRARPLFEHVTSVGASVGVTFDFDRIFNAPNTADAHRLILLAAAAGDEWPLVDRLFRAHFAEGRDVGDREVLVAIAAEAGLDAEAARRYLASDENRDVVVRSQQTAAHLGVTGVPFVVFGGLYGLPGAQPEGVLVQAIDRAVGGPSAAHARD